MSAVLTGAGSPTRVTLPDVSILVVEDDPDHRELMVMALSACCDPARIVTVADGEQALDFLFGRALHAGRDVRKQPRLVLLDLKLPSLQGLDVLKAMRADALTRLVPVVVISSCADKAQFELCYQAGANSVVRKTDDFDEMCRKMRRVHDFWVTVNESDRDSRV